uniref:U3 small nucleolar ribonucleoprotein protein MPP10 n=1 Tax=Rhabditophanes sp. KR3021 TaxID=114890 RepID=A0AC35TIY0_9BILA
MKPVRSSKKKSAVDDKFFNLTEMNDYLDKIESEEQEEGFFDDVDVEDDANADYCYKDFFEVSKGSAGKSKQIFEDDEEDSEDELQDDEEEAEEFDDGDDVMAESDEELGEIVDEKSILLSAGTVEEKSAFEKRQESLKRQIGKLEEQNLAPRNWELAGEITADSREKDSMLATHAAFDYVSKQTPVITPDHTDRVEALIMQRIKDKAFDDPVRKVKKDETIQVYREQAIEEIQRKSLVEVYEDQFKKARGDKDDNSEADLATKQLEKDMNELFADLDGLYHFDFTPTEIVADLQIIGNMPAMRREEVGPLAGVSGDIDAIAPEEAAIKLKGELMASNERSETDKLRERRKKKMKQRDMAASGILKTKPKEAVVRGKKRAIGGEHESESKKLKGSKFFESLQEATQKEIQNKR